MKELENKLRNELLRDTNVKLLATATWSLPVQSFDVSFETVERTKMDILMKMLLTAFRTGSFASAEEVSKLLVVEPLFIQDMMDKFEQTAMIQKAAGTYTLTEKGRQQLESGVYVSVPENEDATVYYSASHVQFFVGNVADHAKETYRYANKSRATTAFEDEEWRNALETVRVTEIEKEHVQKVIQSIKTVTELEQKFVPCIEFQLLHVHNDRLYARVWNTMTEQWDEQLEAQILEHELAQWRERYLAK